MSDNKLRDDIKDIVEDGEKISERVRDAVQDAAHRVKPTPNRLADLTEDALDAAIQAVDRSTPDDPDSTLRQVVDGLAAGIERTAHATRLALEEAASEGRTYADEEVRHVASDLKTIAEMFVDTVRNGLSNARTLTEQRARSVIDHTERTFSSVRPSLEQAARTAAHDPIGLASESAVAAAKVTREAAGGLFSAVGKLLQSTGDRLRPHGDDEDEDNHTHSDLP